MERKNFTNFDEIKARLLHFVDCQGVQKTDFFKKNSLSPSNFAGKGAESALSTTKIVQILTTYGQLNPDWLLLGKGDMLRQNSQSALPDAAQLKKNIDTLQYLVELQKEKIAQLEKELLVEKEKVSSLSARMNEEPILP